MYALTRAVKLISVLLTYFWQFYLLYHMALRLGVCTKIDKPLYEVSTTALLHDNKIVTFHVKNAVSK